MMIYFLLYQETLIPPCLFITLAQAQGESLMLSVHNFALHLSDTFYIIGFYPFNIAVSIYWIDVSDAA